MGIFNAKPGKMMAFSGGQVIALPDSAVFRPERTDSFSIGFWIKLPPAGGLSPTIFTSLGVAAAPPGINVRVQGDNTLRLQLVNTALTNHLLVATNETVDDGELKFCLVTYNGTSSAAGVTFYINGAVATKQAPAFDNLTATIVGTDPINIGGREIDTGLYLNGYMRNFMWFDYELTAADATVLYNNGSLATPNFVALSGALPTAFFPLENGAKDLSANANHGTLDSFAPGQGHIQKAAPTKRPLIKAPSGPVGRAGTGMLSAADTAAGGFAIDEADACTWSWWQRSDAAPFIFVCKVVPANAGRGWTIGTGLSGPSVRGIEFESARVSNGASFNCNTGTAGGDPWPQDRLMHHIVLVKTAGAFTVGNLTAYFDGEVRALGQTNAPDAGSVQDGTNELWVGNRQQSSPGSGMGITNASMHNIAMTQAQVRTLMAKGWDGDISQYLSPLANWPMMDPAEKTTYADRSGNGYDLTIVDGPPTWNRADDEDHHMVSRVGSEYSLDADGSAAGLALRFDRTDAWSCSFWFFAANAAAAAGLRTAISIEADPDTTPTGTSIVMQNRSGVSQLAMQMGSAGGDMLNGLWDVADFDDKWHHVVIAKAAAGGAVANVTFYYDGVATAVTTTLEDTWTTSSQLNGDSRFRISHASSQPRAGMLKNVSVFDATLTAAQAAHLYSMGRDEDLSDVYSPVGQWSLGTTASRTVVPDVSGSGADVTPSAGTVLYHSRSSLAALSSFSPADLFSGAEAGGFYDTTDAATLWQDAGVTAATVSDDPIGRIDDLSGNGDHLNQTTVSDKPTLQTFPTNHADPLAGDFLTSVSVLTQDCTVAVLYPSGDVHFRDGLDAGNGFRTNDNFIALVAIDRALTAGEKTDLLEWFADKAGTLDAAYDYYVDADSGSNGNAGTSPGAAYADFTPLAAAAANTTIGILRGTELQDVYDVPNDGIKIGPYGAITYTETQVDSEPLTIARPAKPLVTGATLETGAWSVHLGSEYKSTTATVDPGGNIPVYHESSTGVVTRLKAGLAGSLVSGEFDYSAGSLHVNVGGAVPDRVWVPSGAYSVQSNGKDDVLVTGLSCRYSSNDGLQYKAGALNFDADSVDCEWNANDGINQATAATDAMIRNCTLAESGREADWLGDGFSAHTTGTGTIRNTQIRWAGKDGISNSEQGSWTIEGCQILHGGQGITIYPEAGVAGAHTINRCVIAGGNGRTGFGAYRISAIVGNASTALTVNNCVIDLKGDLNATSRGIRVDNATMNVKNTSMSGAFNLGYYQASGSLISDYCNAYGMGTPYTTAVEGPNSLRVDPQFVDDPSGDYRLGASSELIDVGVLVAGVTDTYGVGGPEIGRYERTGGAWDVTDLGTVKSWVKGDVGTYTGDVATDLTDAGTLGGTFDAATNAHPVATLVGGRKAPIFRGTRRAQSSVAASNWAFLHDSGSDATVTIRAHQYEQSASFKYLFNTYGAGAPTVGISVYIPSTHKVAVAFGNGASNLVIASTVTISAGDTFTVVVRKAGAGVSLSVNGETPVTGTITSPSASAPDYAPVIGNSPSGASRFEGLIEEIVVHDSDIGTAGAAQMRTYMADQWSATPDFSFLAANGVDVVCHYSAALGVTLNGSDVSALADQSGYNNHITQATPANQPAYLATGGPNSQPALQGAATKYLSVNTFNQGATGVDTTFYSVVGYSGGSGDERLFDGGSGRQIFQANTVVEIWAGSFAGTVSKPSGYGIHTAVFDNTASEQYLRKDGTSTTSETGLSTGTNTLNGFTLLGTNVTKNWLGTVSEIVGYSGTVPSDDSAANAANHAQLEAQYDITPL